eukprot:8792268-Pyramimonas_sp.AAC.1
MGGLLSQQAAHQKVQRRVPGAVHGERAHPITSETARRLRDVAQVLRQKEVEPGAVDPRCHLSDLELGRLGPSDGRQILDAGSQFIACREVHGGPDGDVAR